MLEDQGSELCGGCEGREGCRVALLINPQAAAVQLQALQLREVPQRRQQRVPCRQAARRRKRQAEAAQPRHAAGPGKVQVPRGVP